MSILNQKSFKWKILFYCILSVFIAGIFTFSCVLLLHNLEFLPTLTNTIIRGIIILIIYLFFFLVTYFTLMDMYFRYVKKLSKAINQVANGNFDVFVPIEYQDELGTLANSVNIMAAKLKQSQEIEKETLEKERITHLAFKESEKTKSDLITNVAHDLRTPLTSIIGYLQLLQNNAHLTDEAKEQYLQIAYHKSIRLQQLMDDLFNLSSFSSNEIVYNESIINYSELVSQLIDEYYPVFQENEITVTLDLNKNDLYLLGDGNLIVRVFDNLISNAVKYGKEAGKINIIIKYDEDSITTKITNYGVTIDKESLPHIFEKFYRSDTSRSSDTGGTGLGLAIAKTIIEMHNGEIYAVSRNLKTSFVFILKRHII